MKKTYINLGMGEKKGLKNFFDGGIRLVLERKKFFNIVNIYIYMHTKCLVLNIVANNKFHRMLPLVKNPENWFGRGHIHRGEAHISKK